MTGVDQAELKLLTDLIQERFGLTFNGIRLEILESRLRPRLRELHLSGVRDYYQYLRFHPDRESEFARLPAMVTNNETYFFRETHQFDLLVNHIIPERRASLGTRPLRILSAGCSSGEEPYSLSIALHNAGLPLAGISWEIDACDLNPERIARAQQALYAESSLRACDADARRRYFTQETEGFRLKEKYRRGVRCFHSNLLAPNGALGWAVYDAILCRNLLIYFSDEAFTNLIGLFARCLVPGGYLMLGHSESLLDRKTAFAPAMVGGAVIYRKLAAAA
ncbi:MAG TPA: protein-glutamate O-methyltransferase CheR [Gemmatimonadales bacterium]|nr:protein-glutamate O-methyltransferase CheR [Gemmatimonadales bacterium]